MLIGYARVSTADQDLAGQRLRLERVGVVRIFEDVATGRTLGQRPGLTAALDYARPGDTLTIVRLDRLGRSLRELVDLVEVLKGRNIGLRSLEEAIDTSTATGGLAFHFFAAMAEFERRLIAERTRDGIAAARAKGRVPGRPNSDTLAASARLLVKSGIAPSQAAAQIGISRTTLYRYLRAHPLDDEPPSSEPV